MPIPGAVSGAMSGLNALAGMITGGMQMRRGRKLADSLTRPTYEISDANKEALGTARMRAATSQVPGQRQIEDRLAGTTANSLRAIKEASTNPAALITGVTGLNRTESDAMLDLGIEGAKYQASNMDKLVDELHRYGALEDKAWQLNEYEPYKADAAAASAMIGAGGQNLLKGFGGLTSTAGLMGQDIMAQNRQQNTEIPTTSTTIPDIPQGEEFDWGGVMEDYDLGHVEGLFDLDTASPDELQDIMDMYGVGHPPRS